MVKVLHETHIKRVVGLSLRFRMYQGITSANERAQIRRLAAQASRALHLGPDYRLVFDLTHDESDRAKRMLQVFGGGLEMFETLLEWHTLGILQEVSLFLERSAATSDEKSAPPLHLFDWLSDGEQNFIGRMSLFTLPEWITAPEAAELTGSTQTICAAAVALTEQEIEQS